MAYKMTKRGSLDNEITNEFFCDSVNDLDDIEDIYRTLGSVAIIVSDAMEVYIANSNKEWIPLGALGSSGENSMTDAEGNAIFDEVFRYYEVSST